MAASKIDSLTEFTKTKMHFALALLGTLFALHQFVEKWGTRGFVYLGFDLQIYYAYSLVSALLALTVYFYALALLSERGYSWMEWTGNMSYAIAIMVLPLYGGLYFSTWLANYLGQAHLEVATPTVAMGLGIAWLIISALIARRVRKRLGEQDRMSKIDQLAEQEIVALDRAKELFISKHFDLSVIEGWKAIESRLRRVLLIRRYGGQWDEPQEMIHAASKAKILSQAGVTSIQELRKQWNIAVSTEPLTREAAETALNLTRDILATIPVDLAVK